MIPQNFQQWHYCITVQCGIALTAGFAEERLKIYRQPAHPETRAFIAHYGLRHLHNIILWLEVAAWG